MVRLSEKADVVVAKTDVVVARVDVVIARTDVVVARVDVVVAKVNTVNTTVNAVIAKTAAVVAKTDVVIARTDVVIARTVLRVSPETWTAAACCRFHPRSLLRGVTEWRMQSLRAFSSAPHWLPGQQAGSGKAAAGCAQSKFSMLITAR
jgi:hypothetical protein